MYDPDVAAAVEEALRRDPSLRADTSAETMARLNASVESIQAEWALMPKGAEVTDKPAPTERTESLTPHETTPRDRRDRATFNEDSYDRLLSEMRLQTRLLQAQQETLKKIRWVIIAGYIAIVIVPILQAISIASQQHQ